MNLSLILLIPATPLLLALGSLLPAMRQRLILSLPFAALPALGAALFLSDGAVALDWFLLGAQLGIDSVGRVFLLFTGVLWLAAGWYANDYIHDADRRPGYALFHLLAMSGNLGLIVAQDMASFFLFFALMSFASYGLVIHNRDEEAMRAGRVYLTLVVAGEVILFAGLQRLAAATGELGLPSMSASPDLLTCVLLFVGFGVKAGALPLHIWLPLAHPAAPAPASAVLSGAMIKAGLIGWLRFLPNAHPEAMTWGEPVVWLGLTATFFGALVGCCQTNAKSVLAYSSISQMGLMTAGLGVCFLADQDRGALVAMICLFAAHHALAKGALFLSVGIMAHRPRLPRAVYWGALLAPALTLAGAPFTGGALAKGALKMAGQSMGGWKTLLALSGVGTTLLMLRFIQLGRRMAADAHPAPAGPGKWLPWMLLVLLVTLFPVLPLAGAVAQPAGWWSKVWPIMVGLGMGAILLPRLSSERPLVQPGDLLGWMLFPFRMTRHCWDGVGQFLRPHWVAFRWGRRHWTRRASRLWSPSPGEGLSPRDSNHRERLQT